MVLAWVFFLRGAVHVPMLWDNPVLWHAHEMVYGFTVAIIAGFLLTAVANWTGAAPVRGANLALLCVVWTAGRVSFWSPYGSPVLLSLIDLSFLPLLAGSLAVPLVRTGNKRNFVFLALLGGLFLCNLHMHLAVTGVWGGDPRLTAYGAVLVVMMVISIVGSRIIPSFTVAGLRMHGQLVYQTDQQKTDIAALALLFAATASVAVSGTESLSTGIFAMGAGLLHLWRMKFWHTFRTGREPMLWILHAGHLWLVAGLLALAAHGLGLLDQPSLALHMLTVGCIGSLTIGMMARVTLGHTGRNIVAAAPVAASFLMIQAAALMRCLAMVFQGEDYYLWVAGSGLLWAVAFVVYLAIYAPMLLGRRPDGQEA